MGFSAYSDDSGWACWQVATTPSRTRSCRPWRRGEGAEWVRTPRAQGSLVNVRWSFSRHGPVGLVHVDAHADTSDVMLGEKIGHGTPFRRCVEEGLLDPGRVVQVGLRGSSYSADAYAWSRAQVRSSGGSRYWERWLCSYWESPPRASVWSRWRSAGSGPWLR